MSTDQTVRRAATPAPARRPRGVVADGRLVVWIMVPALALWLAFSRGGFFVGETGVAAVAVCLALLLWATLAPNPLAGLSRAGAVAMCGWALLTVLVLASAAWSDAAARTVYEFDRLVLYLGAFTLLALVPGGTTGARWLVRATAACVVVVCVAGLLARLYPALIAPAGAQHLDRLSWPLGYWNAMGLAAATGLVLLLHLAANLDEHPSVRALAAAATPAVAATMYLTLSRGAILAAILGLLLLVLLGRSPGLPSALPAVAPVVALAVLAAAGADALSDGYDVASEATLQAGRALGRELAGLTAAAAVIRLVLLPLDRRLAARRPRPWSAQRRLATAVATLALLAFAAVALDASHRLADHWHTIVSSEAVVAQGDRRLLATSPNGRIQHWDVALRAFARQPVRGVGAGAYVYEWAQARPFSLTVQDAHSLYLETLAELGVVGLALLAVGLVVPLGAAVARRREDRVLWSAVVAVAAMWLIRAGIDWDWEMPALALPVIALLAVACAADDSDAAERRPLTRLPRVLAGLAVLLIAVTPARVAVSQAAMDDALAAFRANDCPRAIDRALAAQSALGMRADPYELLGYCDVRLRQTTLAARMLETAARKDPRSWEVRYGLALVQAARGEDPRPELRQALQRNPREPILLDASNRMRGDQPAVWRREAAASPLVVPTLALR